MKKYILTIVAIFSILTLPSLSAFQCQAIERECTVELQDQASIGFEQAKANILDSLDEETYEKVMTYLTDDNLEYQIEHLLSKMSSITRIIDFIKDNGNFTSIIIIMALVGSLMFFILTQPIFLQLIVETGNDTDFITLIISLIFIEIIQKFFALKAINMWDPIIKEDIDGFWNFFSIVFFSIYFKIFLSYIPTFIIQYSTVPVKAFFYVLMFTIPIVFNFFIADSIDLIDWNGDEWPVPDLG